MGIGSIGSTPSLWQQDQNYWNQQQSESATSSASDSLINAMGSAETNLAKGLASIANETALKRVNTELTAAIQSVLSGNATPTSSSGSTGSTSSLPNSTSSASASAAIGTGSAPLTTSTPLATLGIPAGGSITISAGGDTTTYASTGTDTVGDLMNAINEDYVGNAPVTASLSPSGDLVITSKNTTNMITIGGLYALNIGFATGHDSFKPTTPPSNSPNVANSSSSSTSSAATSSSGTNGSSSNSTKVSTSLPTELALAEQDASSAEGILSAAGVSGSLVNMLV